MAAYLERQLAALGIRDGLVTRADAFTFLLCPTGRFDVVFLDPPFQETRQDLLLDVLIGGGWLNPGAWIFLEWARRGGGGPFGIPPGWELWRESHTGQVAYALIRESGPDRENPPAILSR